MNNSGLSIDSQEETIDKVPWLRQKETELLKILEAIEAVSGSNHWKVLERHIWNGLSESLSRKLSTERDTMEMARLQGQIVLANKFSDLKKLTEVYRLELTNIRQQLNGKKE